jgi:predicted nuclease of predicted toxin-antitoxin system
MKLLLDECVPRRLKNDFPGHDVRTIEEVGLKGVLDAELLRAADVQRFQALITVGRRLILKIL